MNLNDIKNIFNENTFSLCSIYDTFNYSYLQRKYITTDTNVILKASANNEIRHFIEKYKIVLPSPVLWELYYLMKKYPKKKPRIIKIINRKNITLMRKEITISDIETIDEKYRKIIENHIGKYYFTKKYSSWFQNAGKISKIDALILYFCLLKENQCKLATLDSPLYNVATQIDPIELIYLKK